MPSELVNVNANSNAAANINQKSTTGLTMQPYIFIVLIRVSDHMRAWREQKSNSIWELKGAKKEEEWVQRFLVAYELSTGALKYLNDKK